MLIVSFYLLHGREEMFKNTKKLPEKLLHGGDYNPEQWLDCPEILEEDMDHHCGKWYEEEVLSQKRI